jgi:ribonuclease HII
LYTKNMVGIDEVGRGCLAGPLLVVAARQKIELPPGLADSKILTKTTRESLFELLILTCEFGEGWVKSSEIDTHGLTKAMRLGVARALKSLKVEQNEEIIMDGPVNYFPKKFKKVTCLIDADATVPLVSAASIYAKVNRDRYMSLLKKSYPSYGFERHVGYGTPFHLSAIQQFGSIKNVHRMSYKPLKAI